MKLLLISLSVVFCFSCDSPFSSNTELDTSLKKEDESYSIGRWSSANEEKVFFLLSPGSPPFHYGDFSLPSLFVETGYNLYVEKKWRFISYIPSDTLGRVKVKGVFEIEYRNPNPISAVFRLNRLSFLHEYNYQIAEYNIEYKLISVEANGNGSYSFDFEIDLDNISLANDITRATTWGMVHIPRE